jgi:hypothetical protein
LAGGRGPDREVRASRPASVRPRFGEDSDKSSWKKQKINFQFGQLGK